MTLTPAKIKWGKLLEKSFLPPLLKNFSYTNKKFFRKVWKHFFSKKEFHKANGAFHKIAILAIIITIAFLTPVFAHHISASASTWKLYENKAEVDFLYPLADIVYLVSPEHIRKQETFIEIIKPVDDALLTKLREFLNNEIPSKIILAGCSYKTPLETSFQGGRITVHAVLECQPSYDKDISLTDNFLVAVNNLHVSQALLIRNTERMKCLFRSGFQQCSPMRAETAIQTSAGESSASLDEIQKGLENKTELWKEVIKKGKVQVFHGYEQWLFFLFLILAVGNAKNLLKTLAVFIAFNFVSLIALFGNRLPEPSTLKPLVGLCLLYSALTQIVPHREWKISEWGLFGGFHLLLLILAIVGLFTLPAPAIVGMALIGYGIISISSSEMRDNRILLIISALFGLIHGLALAVALKSYSVIGALGVSAMMGLDFYSNAWPIIALTLVLIAFAYWKTKTKNEKTTNMLIYSIMFVGAYLSLTKGLELPGGGLNYRDSVRALEDMISKQNIGSGMIAFSLILAVILGALHALTPGHGKTIVAAYLIGSKGRVIDALILGIVVTLTHTFSVLLLGLIALTASRKILPQELAPYLGALSGALIGIMGFAMLYTRGRNFIKYGSAVREHSHHHLLDEHNHDETHTHAHPHTHTDTDTASRVKLRDLVILGISGGLVPCADAFVVLLIAIYMGRVALGMIIILAFSLGLAGILIAIGVMMVKAKPLVEKLGMGGNFIKGYLPIASALLVSIIGVYITYQSVAKLM